MTDTNKNVCKTCNGSGVVDEYSTWEGSCPDCTNHKPSQPIVKPLVWEVWSETTQAAGGYVLKEPYVCHFVLLYQNEILGEYSGGAAQRFAKAAAQADHEQRILSEIEYRQPTVQEATPFIPNKELINRVKSLGEEVAKLPKYERRQLEAIFAPSQKETTNDTESTQ